MQTRTNSTASDVIDQLNAFLRGEISAVESYRRALNEVKTGPIRQSLIQGQSSHEQRVDLLRNRILELGGTPAQGSGAWGVLAKAAEGGAAVFGEAAALAVLEEGEDHGLKDYDSGIGKLDRESRELVEKQLLPAQMQTHRVLSAIKQQHARS